MNDLWIKVYDFTAAICIIIIFNKSIGSENVSANSRVATGCHPWVRTDILRSNLVGWLCSPNWAIRTTEFYNNILINVSFRNQMELSIQIIKFGSDALKLIAAKFS